MANKTVISKDNWVSNFNIVGKALVNDYTFNIDKRSERSAWIYNSMGLMVDCGEKHGVIRVDMMGGYSDERDTPVYAHGKDEDGRDDFKKQIIVSWDDRLDDEVLDEIGELSFLTVGLEKTTEGKTYYKKFLSAYDAIKYIKEHLTSDTVVRVKGRLSYSTYNDVVQVKKEVQSIVLSNVEDSSSYNASFTQSILIDKESAGFDDIDKDKGVMYINAYVLDYVKEINGVEIRGQYPFSYTFEFPMDFSKEELCKKIYNKLFKVKKGVTQITMDGEFVEGGAVVNATMDDVPDDIKELIDLGIYTEEEALAKCSSSGSRERRMLVLKPATRRVGEEGVLTLQVFPEKYEEEELEEALAVANGGNDEVPFEADSVSDSSNEEEVEEDSDGEDVEDWLSKL